MPTRFYLDNNLASPLPSLGFDAAWEQTGGADRRYSPRKGLVRTLSTLANQTAQTVPITTTQQILSRQYVTDPVPSRIVLACRISICIRVLEANAGANAFLAWVLRVVDKDGATTPRAVGSSMTNTGTEYSTSAQTRIFTLTGLASTPLTMEVGERFVFEVGAHVQAPSIGTTYTHRYGIAAGADFALTSGLTTDLNPWWELDQDIWPVGSTNQISQGGRSR